jgi:hypothetical protein
MSSVVCVITTKPCDMALVKIYKVKIMQKRSDKRNIFCRSVCLNLTSMLLLFKRGLNGDLYIQYIYTPMW